MAQAVPRFRKSRALQWLFFLAVALIVCAPITMVLLDGFNVAPDIVSFKFGIGNWAQAWHDPQVGSALWYTFTIVTLRAVLGFAIAIPLAWLVARTNIPFPRQLEFGFWIAFFMPSLAYIQGWTFLLEGYTGLVNQWFAQMGLGRDLIDIYSYWGIIWVHLMSQNVSALFILLVLGFSNMDSSYEEAARVTGATKTKTLRQIVLPLSRPLIAMLVVLAIIRGMQSYEIEAVLGAPVNISVYSTLLVNMITDEPPRLAQGAALSSLVLIILVPLIIFQRLYVGRRQYATVSGKMRVNKVDLGSWRWPAFGLVLFIVLLQTLVPAFATLCGSLMKRWGYFSIPHPWTLSHWHQVLSSGYFLEGLRNTITIGVLAGIAGAVVCFIIAYVLVRTDFPGRGSLDFVCWLPWAVPGVLLSLGLISFVLSIPPMRFLHGTLLILIVAIIMFRFPVGVHLLRTGLMQLNPELEEASTICGSLPITTQLRINMPILMPMLIAVALMTFVTAVNEVSGVVLLASTHTRTLSLISLDFLRGSESNKEAAAVITVIMILLCTTVALGARAFGIRLGDQGAGTPGKGG